MLRDSIKTKGSLSITVYDKDFEIINKLDIDNLVVNTGKNYMASRMSSNNTPIISHMSVGSVNSAPVVTETGLGNELGRVALNSTTVTGNNIAYVATFPAGVGTGSLKEAGLFNANVGGSMLSKTQFSLIKNVSDTIVISWNISIL